jgi:hypothetical protein
MVERVFTNSIDLINYFQLNPLVIYEHGSTEIRRARTTSDVAEELLAENKFCIIDGQTHYFNIKHLGFKTYLIRPRPADKVNTFICDGFERHLIKIGESSIPTEIY